MIINVKGRAKSVVAKPLAILGTIKLTNPTFSAGGISYTFNALGAKSNGGILTVVENTAVSGTVVSGTIANVLVSIESLAATTNTALKAAVEAAFPAITVGVAAIGASAPTAYTGTFAGGVGSIEGVESVVNTGTGLYTITLKARASKLYSAHFDVISKATGSAIARVAVENADDLIDEAFTVIKVSTRSYAGAAASATLADDYLCVNAIVKA